MTIRHTPAISRRTCLQGMAAAGVAAALPGSGFSQTPAQRLEMPPLLDATQTGRATLRAQAGKTNFLGQSVSNTLGFNQDYLGPVLRLARGETEISVENTLNEPISTHWHGLLIPGEMDGGPHQAIAPGETWSVVLPITQPTATTWYHSHIHERTAEQVHNGLAGVLQITDGRDDDRGLPSAYGEDDLMLIVQDRRIDWRGRMRYSPGMQDTMLGFIGDRTVVNGQVDRIAVVPGGIVRLRLLNASNARIYDFSFASGRALHLIATDSGLLPAPVSLASITLAPGERAELLVDFAASTRDRLLSAPVNNVPMKDSMMGSMLISGSTGPFEVMKFQIDTRLSPRITGLPSGTGEALPDLDPVAAVERGISLDMKMGGGMLKRIFSGASGFSINGAPFDMQRIDLTASRGTTELWRVSGALMMHPFHIHGTRFQVLAENGAPPQTQNRGWKDTVLVNGNVYLLMQFEYSAPQDTPYMYHCHILEHEDAGMMGQFTVS
jgi:FtsP/CotA-like multicopper oxidase with cupredoxin domain